MNPHTCTCAECCTGFLGPCRYELHREVLMERLDVVERALRSIAGPIPFDGDERHRAAYHWAVETAQRALGLTERGAE